MKVLIVDDIALMRLGLKMTLRQEVDLEIFEAEDFDSAIKVLEEHNDIGLMLLDLSLSNDESNAKKNGLNIMKFAEAKGLRVPYTVIISGTADESKVAHAVSVGAKNVLKKPVKHKYLFNEVTNARYAELEANKK